MCLANHLNHVFIIYSAFYHFISYLFEFISEIIETLSYWCFCLLGCTLIYQRSSVLVNLLLFFQLNYLYYHCLLLIYTTSTVRSLTPFTVLHNCIHSVHSMCCDKCAGISFRMIVNRIFTCDLVELVLPNAPIIVNQLN